MIQQLVSRNVDLKAIKKALPSVPAGSVTSMVKKVKRDFNEKAKELG
jgi:hypothetical protein